MEEVLSEEKGGYGILTLNREKALNAINHTMILEMRKKLLEWKDNDHIKSVIIQSNGDKAFCAGGDVKAVYEDGLAVKHGDSDGDLIADFFFDEYQLNTLIHNYPKPFIALINGVSMGGGVGISVHGSHRIVSENLLFAMPETGIGLFPDVGGGYFLSKAPGYTGLFVGLTGHRMNVADALYIGYGTDYVEYKDFDAFLSDLTEGNDLDTVLSEYKAISSHECYLADHLDEINEHFSKSSLKDIFLSLETAKDDSEFAAKTLKILKKMSPTSMALFFEQYKRAKDMSFEDVMVMEYRLSQGCMHGCDFFEGIRALLIDKDKNPQWEPSDIEELDTKLIQKYFETVPRKGDLTFL